MSVTTLNHSVESQNEISTIIVDNVAVKVNEILVPSNQDTYPICDNQSSTSSISLIHSNPDQDEMEQETMSQDSLIHDEDDHHQQSQPVSLSTSIVAKKCPFNSQVTRMNNLDEHIRLVKQKKEEADVLRLRRFQEQLRKKEQKWQQQQLERVKKWLQLRNRDLDHRAQVEERRRKREEETKAKLDELVRREKEREQKANSNVAYNLRINTLHNPDGLMTVSTDILFNRQARLRFNQQDMSQRRKSNDSPMTIASQDRSEQPTSANSSHQHNTVDGQRYRPSSRQSNDITMTNDDSTVPGTAGLSARSRSRPVPTSYNYWLNTGENNTMSNVNFMRLTYAATCRSRHSRSVERCPRACRGRDEVSATNGNAANGETQRRIQSISRQQLQETICRLAKPKIIPMAQSIQLASALSSTNGIPASHSSHQLRSSTPPVSWNNYLSPGHGNSTTRRPYSARSITSTRSSNSPHDSRASPVNECASDTQSSAKSSSARANTHGKPPLSKPPISSASPRSKPTVQRSMMTTSHSSSSLSTSLTANKSNSHRTAVSPAPTSKTKPIPTDITSLTNGKEFAANDAQTNEQNEPVLTETQSPPAPIETNTDVEATMDTINASAAPSSISKREQQILDEQEYQRKLNQKIREAQQRMELERQREEERQRQLELEEYEREQEQIRLVEEQRRAEEERLQRAIRENEIKRQEEQRLQQQREELEKRQAEEAERLQRERQEKAKKEEEERIERKKRLDLIMRRTRPTSPTSKNENLAQNNFNESNGHDRPQSSMSHSISDHHFSSNSSSTENILNQADSTVTNETPKFKSPLIQNLLNKARNTRSSDNLTQSTNTASDEEHQELDLQSINNGSSEFQATPLISPS